MAKDKRTSLEQDLIEGLQEAVKHSKGEIKLRESLREIPKPAPQYTAKKIKKIREELGYTQPDFAAALNVRPITVSSWEQGIRTPKESTNRLLQLFEIDGAAIVQRLGKVGGR